MKTPVYRIETSCKKKSIYIYFDSFIDAREYARTHNIEQMTVFLADIESVVEMCTYEAKKIERKVIEFNWNRYREVK